MNFKLDNKYLEKIVSLINKQRADIVLFTGDFLDDENNSYGKVIDVTQAKTDIFTIENSNGKILFFLYF